jgi:hypothetical protein
MAASFFFAPQAVAVQGDAAPSIEQASQEVYCGVVPGKGYKCSDGVIADDGATLRQLNAQGQTLLHITARVDVSACEAGMTRYTTCVSKRLPASDVMIVPKEECNALGHLLAKAKFYELTNLGWKSSIIFKCD